MSFRINNFSAFQRKTPTQVAQDYARQNGISLSEAQETLREQYGDPQVQQNQPQQPQQFPAYNNNQEMKTELQPSRPSGNQGLQPAHRPQQPQGPAQSQNPEDYARVYAQLKGISIEEAREELRRLYGDPVPPNNSVGNRLNFGA